MKFFSIAKHESRLDTRQKKEILRRAKIGKDTLIKEALMRNTLSMIKHGNIVSSSD